jgi:hypothetical protein
VPTTPQTSRFLLHGLAVEVDCGVPELLPELQRLLGSFRVTSFPARCQPTTGSIKRYEEADVLRRLSPRARRVELANASSELYEDGERFWMIDDRWGMLEINLMKSQWRAWLLPHARVDAVRQAEAALLWPMAQLLRAKGLYLLPAASIVRSGVGLLMLSPLGLAPELSALVRAGCRVVGQRWTALRERDGRIEMLHLPGLVERPASPRTQRESPTSAATTWTDLAHEHYGCEVTQHACDGVFVIQRGRRPNAHLRQLTDDALDVIRAGWPIEELHPLRRHGQLPAKLAGKVPAYEIALSREPNDLLALLSALPQRGMGIHVTTAVKRPPLMLQRTVAAA